MWPIILTLKIKKGYKNKIFHGIVSFHASLWLRSENKIKFCTDLQSTYISRTFLWFTIYY